MIETSEDKLVRILTRASFEVVDRAIRDFLHYPATRILPEANDVYKILGWRREEYHAEVKRRAANRG
jgi:hypothetical protein